MKTMTPFYRYYSICLVLILSYTIAGSQVTAYEGFDYTTIGATLEDSNGGVGFSSSWQPKVNPSHLVIAEGSLSYSNLMTEGNRVTKPAQSSITEWYRNIPITGTSGTSQYISFLVRPEGELNEGLFNGYFGLHLISTGQDPFFGKPGDGEINNYVYETLGGSDQISSLIPAIIDETAMIIVRIDFKDGADDISLIVNPDLSMAEPAPTVSGTYFDIPEFLNLTINATGAFSMDEIRLGDTYASVTPSDPIIPSMGQWALLIFFLLLASLSIAKVSNTLIAEHVND